MVANVSRRRRLSSVTLHSGAT